MKHVKWLIWTDFTVMLLLCSNSAPWIKHYFSSHDYHTRTYFRLVSKEADSQEDEEKYLDDREDYSWV